MAPISELSSKMPMYHKYWDAPVVERPWLSLYGTRIRAVAPAGSVGHKPVEETALIHSRLPDELLLVVFEHLRPVFLGRAACVCRKWRYTARAPSLWQTACTIAWPNHKDEELEEMVRESAYGGSWKRMFCTRPYLRTDGIYVSRNTYIRVGIVEWKTKNPVHLVCYFRYIRFLPSGKFYYKVSPHFLKEVAKSMTARPSAAKADGVLVGRCTLEGVLVSGAILYPGLRPTVLRMRMRLRGTCPGANNRLDILNLLTCGMDEAEVPNDVEDVLNVTQNWEDDESHNPDVPARSHSRGTEPYVFVPFEEVETDILNLPVDKMDYYRPG